MRFQPLFFLGFSLPCLVGAGALNQPPPSDLSAVVLKSEPTAKDVRSYLEAIRDVVQPKWQRASSGGPDQYHQSVSDEISDMMAPKGTSGLQWEMRNSGFRGEPRPPVGSIIVNGPAGTPLTTIIMGPAMPMAPIRSALPTMPPKTNVAAAADVVRSVPRSAIQQSVGLRDQIRSKLLVIPSAYVDLLIAASEAIDADTPERAFVDTYKNLELDWPKTTFTRGLIAALGEKTDLGPHGEKVIFEHLDTVPELVSVVTVQGWGKELEPFLTKKFVKQIDDKRTWGSSLTTWIDLLLHCDTDAAREALVFLLTEARGPTMAVSYTKMRKLDRADFDRSSVAQKAWASLNGKMSRQLAYAHIAAENGNREGLILMAQVISGKISDPSARVYLSRFDRVLQKTVDFTSPDSKQIAEYVLANRDRLQFDAQRHQFAAKN
jgi:hypothetical protein